MGEEFIGIVEAVGSDLATVNAGDLVVSPFLRSDGSCVFCREGLQSECVFDRTGSIEDVPAGYRAMNEREVLKFQIKPEERGSP